MTTWTAQTEYATNLLPYSEDFSLWTLASNVSLQPGQTDPFGQPSAVRITDTSSAAFGQVLYTLNLDGTVTRVFSAFVMKDSDTSRVCSIRMNYTGGVSMSIRLNTYTGEVATVTGSGITLVNHGVDDYDSAWRIYVASYKDTLVNVGLLPSNATTLSSSASVSIKGSATFFGAQLEVGTDPTGYIKTEGVSVTSKKLTEWARQ